MYFVVEREEAGFGIWVVGQSIVSLMRDCWPHTVKPCMLVHVSGGNKCGSSDLLSVEAKAGVLGTILTMWKSSRNSFTGVLVSESLLIGIGISWSGCFRGLGIREVELCADKVLASLCFCGCSRHILFWIDLFGVCECQMWMRTMCGGSERGVLL